MNLINLLLGKILHGIAKIIDIVLGLIINVIQRIIIIVKGFFKGILVLLTMGGCLILLLFIRFGLMILMNPAALMTIIILLILPMLGNRSVAYLKYLRFILVEFLTNTGNHLVDKKKYRFVPFKEYKFIYKKAESERRRRERERFYQQQQQWYQQWNQHTHHQGSYYHGQGSQGFGNPKVEFKKKYENSCSILGVANTANKNEIKLAYRKLAKEYHPDLNKDPNATDKFKEISDAYNFLNEENQQRYKNANS